MTTNPLNRIILVDSGKTGFIKITKTALLAYLKIHHIKCKYRDQICDSVKAIIQDSIYDFILQAEEQQRIIEGQESLRRYIENDN